MGIVNLLASNSFITYNKSIAKEVGVDEAILIGELCSLQTMYGEDFFYDQQKILDETCLTMYRLQNATKVLKSKGIISVTKRGIPCKNYYSVNEKILTDIIDLQKTSLPKIAQTGIPKIEQTCIPKIDSTINKKELIRKENKKDILDSQPKHRYGEYQNVLLTDNELDKLKSEFPDLEERIERLSEYIASKGAKYKSHLATIRSWARKDGVKANDSVEQDKRKKADDRARAEAQAWLESTKGTK